jgi:uncharacterized protein
MRKFIEPSGRLNRSAATKLDLSLSTAQLLLGRMKEDSDIDISVYYDGSDASEFRLKVLSDLFDDVYDIKIFQQLPLPLRMQVLKGKVLYEDDTSFMYDKAYETIKEFEDFKRGYYDYLGIESIT